MSKLGSRNIRYTLNSVGISNNIKSIDRSVKQAVPVVTGFADTGPRRITDNYDWDTKVQGDNDFAAGGPDATIFNLVGAAPVATTLQPTGQAPGTDDPNYTGDEVLESYSIKGAIGQPVTYDVSLAGASALTRATS